MAVLGKGINKIVTLAEESVWGEAPVKTDANAIELRRVSADFNLTRESYQSEEIATHKQISDMRLGVRGAEGTLNGELSPASYAKFFEAALDASFVAVPAITGVDITITAGTAQGTYDVEFGTAQPSVVVGSVINFTGTDAENEDKNVLVIGAVDTKNVVVKPLGQGVTLVDDVATAAGVTFVGKRVMAPLTGHLQKSFTVEEWYSDVQVSELFTGMKVGTLGLEIPASGMVTCNFGLQGRDSKTDTVKYFTAAQASNTKGVYAASTGALIVDGKPIGVVTSISLSLDRSPESAIVVGSNYTADISTGRIVVTGSMEVYFQDSEFKKYFEDEKKISLVAALTAGTGVQDDAFVITLPSLKIQTYTRSDSEQFIMASCDFQALLSNPAAAGQLPSTMVVTDASSVI